MDRLPRPGRGPRRRGPRCRRPSVLPGYVPVRGRRGTQRLGADGEAALAVGSPRLAPSFGRPSPRDLSQPSGAPTAGSSPGETAAQSLVQGEASRLPAPLHRPLRDVEYHGGLGLGHTLVKQKVDDSAVLVGEGLDLGVEVGPFGEPARVISVLRPWKTVAVPVFADNARVVGAHAERPGVVPGQVD